MGGKHSILAVLFNEVILSATNSVPLEKRAIDLHVHLVGNGSGGTGCWMRPTGWHRALAFFMVRHLGLPADAMKGDLDRIFVERLLHFVRTSSLAQVVILAHEEVYGEDRKKLTDLGSFHVPNTYVLQLARKNPEFLAAVAIHPARPDALEELDRCLEEGAVMMKCLPNCQNIDCNLPRYRRFWERMAEAGLPLLAHTGGEHTVPVVRAELADPQVLTLPLQCGVKVIAAHCATSSGLFDREYFYTFLRMLEKFPNLYGDNSAFNVPFRGRRISECLRPPAAGRILHGSDFPVPVNGHFAWLRRRVSWDSFRRWQRHQNILERDYQLKRAMGFPPESFEKVRELLRLPPGK